MIPWWRSPVAGYKRRSTRSSPTLIIGLGLSLAFIIVALLADILAPGDPFRSVGPPFQAPANFPPFGTDDLGRSLFHGVVHGARTSLSVGFAVAAASLLIGVLVGGVAGFFGGWIDDALMRFTELVLILPRFFLALVVVALFGPSLINLVMVLALTSWGFVARIVRSGVLSARGLEYVLAARSLGRSEVAILARHVLPNVMAPVVAYGALLIGNAILIEAGLSFIGLGDPNIISWGYLLNNAQAFMRRAWWLSMFPGLAIALTVLGINLLGDGVNAFLNPKQSR